MSRPFDDFNVMAAGQGGDGSLTLVDLLGNLLGAKGFNLYESRSVASRIKGGPATACLRASTVRRGGLGDRFDLVVALDEAAVQAARPWLDERTYLIHDESDAPLADGLPPAGATVLEVPFGRIAVSELRRDLYKNVLAFGIATRLLGCEDGEAEAALRRSLSRLPAGLVDANACALRRGFQEADRLGFGPGGGVWTVDPVAAEDRMLITGNEAAALGFLAAGGRFFAGYPITPASEILAWLSVRLPEFGGVAVQAEDELAAINLALGAAMAGVRAMTASSGPGIALMQEGVGHLGSAEIGLLVIDCQRAGPSTGMPTKPEQSDLGMLVHGANGDFPRLVLTPGDPQDAFELTALGLNLAERFQGPVYLALDQATAQDAVTVPRFDLSVLRVDRGKLLGAADLARRDEYRRYAVAADGISPWVAVGTPGGQHLVTGNERDEWGLVTTAPGARTRMVDKRARKLRAVLPELPPGRRFGAASAPVGLLGFGMESGVMREAAERLEAAGLPVQGLQVLTIWPVLNDVLGFAAGCTCVHVVEHNAGGQYADLLAAAGVPRERLHSILRYDGVPFRPGELADHVLEWELG